jgi:serine/threonine protein kinase
MNPSFNITFQEYAPVLKKHGIPFREKEQWLFVGRQTLDKTWLLYISVQPNQAIALLDVLIPHLQEKEIGFSLVRNQLWNYKLNAGDLGPNEVGKVITLYLKAGSNEICNVKDILSILSDFDGPAVPGSFKIGHNLYGHFSEILSTKNGSPNQIRMRTSVPAFRKIPFPLDPAYILQTKRSRILGKFYLPVKVLRVSPKGNITRVISIKRLSFKPYVIKEGKAGVLEDHLGRDIRDRLTWQESVVRHLQEKLQVPRILESFMQGKNKYLVMDWMDGQELGVTVKNLLKGRSWKMLPTPNKINVLGLYIKILETIDIIHSNGYVHRDISDTNFIVLSNGDLAVIDFEMAYSVEKRYPFPPFILGTPGYASPEQLQYAEPSFSEDIYSLGALLAFMVTGTTPNILIGRDEQKFVEQIDKLIPDKSLQGIIKDCLIHAPELRPDMKTLRLSIDHVIQNYN